MIIKNPTARANESKMTAKGERIRILSIRTRRDREELASSTVTGYHGIGEQLEEKCHEI